MNNYHIYDEIGRGKQSVVYKGRKKKSFEYLAVKSVEKSRRKKILNEVKIMHSLDNDHILKFYNWYETRNHLWIIFEYCPGGSLNTLIEADKKLPEDVVIDFGFNIVEALFYLHSNGIIYCDLKPHTILFTEYGVLKLSDFGLAKRIVELIQVEDNTEKKGSPFYMAPELFQEDGVPSFYSDFWSLGCVLYELATGQPPFVSSSLQDLVQKILDESSPQIPGFSSDFNALISDLLEKDCSKRISWNELLSHKAWRSHSRQWTGTMTPQPLYESYLSSKSLKQRTAASNSIATHIPKVDVVRISQNIHKNLLRESREYSQKELETADVKLKDKDQILDFGEHLQDDEDIEKNSDKDILEEEVFEEEKIVLAEKVEKNAEIKEKPKTDNFRPMTIQTKIREIPMDDKNHQRSNSAQNTPSSRSLYKAPPIEEIIMHTSDNTVKPIVGNKEIDKPLELTFSTQTLGFATWSQEEILSKSDSPELEEHFHVIFSALNSSIIDKQNLLSYFESMILNSIVANKLINSAFVNVFIKILKNGKNPLIKARVCSILGQLLRHSTLINMELSQSGLFQALSDLVKDRNEKLARKAMAALGEYLFYASTQMDELKTEWEIPNSIFLQVIRTIKSTEDEALKFYAVKTIENICAQSKKAGIKFSNPEVLSNLIGIYNSSKHEIFRISAAVAISHMIKLNLALIPVLLDKLPGKVLVSGIIEEQPRIQQAFFTIILHLFLSDSRYCSQITEDKQFLTNLIASLESSTIVIRGKSLLVCYFALKSNPKCLIKLSELKFFTVMEKLVRDTYKYVQNGMCHVLDCLGEMAVHDLEALYGSIRKGSKSASCQSILLIVNSLACSIKLPYQQCLKLVSEILSLSFSCKNIECLQQGLLIIEALILQPKHLLKHSDYVVSNVLALLLDIRTAGDNDIRFRCLKIFSDILIPFLYEESIYDPNASGKNFTKVLNDIIVKVLLPLYKDILKDIDPIPLYALKLLSAILDRCISFTTALKNLGLVPLIIENFEGNNPKLNLHLISVVKKIIESREHSLEELGDLRLIEKVTSVMKVIQEQDWCVDKMLDILYDLLALTADTLRTKKSEYSVLRITDPLSENLVSCIKILDFMNEPV
jgi:serine/threonine-protein kinase ULK4